MKSGLATLLCAVYIAAGCRCGHAQAMGPFAGAVQGALQCPSAALRLHSTGPYAKGWTGFVNDAQSIRLSISLDVTSGQFGEFSLHIEGDGDYTGTAAVYRGPGQHLTVCGTVPTEYSPDSVGAPGRVAILLNGTIDAPADASASNGTFARLVFVIRGRDVMFDVGGPLSAAQRAGAIALARATCLTFSRHDWQHLYQLTAPELRAVATEQAFVSMFTSDRRSSSLACRGLSGTMRNTTTALRAQYLTQYLDCRLTTSKGVAQAFKLALYMEFERGKWWVAGTSDIPSA
jgi:hypothetical protein